MLHGVTSFQLDATPTWGLFQSSSVMPTARSIARAGALEGPSVTSRERIFRFGVPSVLGESAIRTQYDRRADGGYP